MEYFNSKTKKMLVTCIVSTFMGQIYVNPFSSTFRFSLSVVAFTLFIYWYQELDIIPTAIITGTFLFVFRIVIQLMITSSPFLFIFTNQFPVIIFYTIYGLLLKFLKFTYNYDDKLAFLFIISISDALSNITEILVRVDTIDFQNISAILLVGFIRATIAFFVIEAVKYYGILMKKEEHEERYKQLIILTSNLKSEVFFLKKSMDDMENAMEKSYQLYQNLNEYNQPQVRELSFQALSIAKDIHEIKKDYMRVSAGLEKILPEIESYDGMYLKDLLNLIKISYEKNSEIVDKSIEMEYLYFKDIYINQVYELISIINNLIINSIEAIHKNGRIILTIKTVKEYLEIYVQDNGRGIEPENMSIIFNPGYTTKFDEVSGKMNSGIGLTHVIYIVKNTLEGDIQVKSKINESTVFKIMIPLRNI